MDPKDLLAVMYYESGLNPAIQNNGKATGLIQFMPDTLKGLGFQGDQHDFKQTDAESQLDYVEKYVRNQMRYNGGPFKSATQYYVANIWPAALRKPGVINQEPNTPIIESDPKVQKYPGVTLAFERQSYKQNSGLDVDKDGVISYGDLDKVMNGVKSSSGFRFALNQLENGKEYAVNTKPPTEKKPESKPEKVDESYLAQVDNLLDGFLSSLEAEARQNLMKKKSDLKSLDKNTMLITIASNDSIDSIEFARIVCAALDEEVQADSSIMSSNDQVEVQTTVYGPGELCFHAVAQLVESLVETFEEATKKIGGVKIKAEVLRNAYANYPALDIKAATTAYRKFHYKFIK